MYDRKRNLREFAIAMISGIVGGLLLNDTPEMVYHSTECDDFEKDIMNVVCFDIEYDENEWYNILKLFGMEVERR